MRHILAALLLTLGACTARQSDAPGSRFLYVWAGDSDYKESDFLAVVDVRPSSDTYRQVLGTVPVGMSGTLPHHMEYQLPDSNQWLFVNGHHHERIFLFDTRNAERPSLVKALSPPAPFRYPHDMVRLPGGNLLIGYLRSEGPSPLPGDSTSPGGSGGIVELTPEGVVVRTGSAADSGFAAPIRPYSFAMRPDIDRMLMTSALMMEDTSADVVQVWQLSNLRRLTTIAVPPARRPDGRVLPEAHGLPFEPRVMLDGSILFNAYGCGFYRVTGMETVAPSVSHVYTIDVPDQQLGSCGVPVVRGNFWVMSVGKAHLLVSLDITDPAHPKEVARLAADSVFRPHWLASDPASDRIIVGAENGGETRMLVARLETLTGQLAWDRTFRTPGGPLGVSFERGRWPHGATGHAFGHAALFRR